MTISLRWSLVIMLTCGMPQLAVSAKLPGNHKILPVVDKVKVDANTERVIKGALKFLSAQQRFSSSGKRAGYWEGRKEGKEKIALTGYVLMAYMAAGNLPGEGPFGKEVSLGLIYLLQQVDDDTGIYGAPSSHPYHYMYGHGIATIALSELYGQTRDQRIRKKLQSVVERIVACQNAQGGWRYRPVKRDADISVTVLQCVALRAAKNSGIDVPQQTLDNAVKYVKSCFHSGSGGFSYQPGARDGFARTAAAIYSLQVCGLYEDSRVKSGSRYLFDKFRKDSEWFVYGNFYAAPAQYMQGGDTWVKWYPMVKDYLMKSVKRENDICYWEPIGRFRQGGAVFTTSVFTMILAMPYHYVPLYQR
jgi:hypothetical protein